MLVSETEKTRARLKSGELVWLEPDEVALACRDEELSVVYKLQVPPAPEGERIAGDRRAKATIAALATDRMGDIIDPAGIDLEPYLANPVVLMNHDRFMPIGRAEELVRPRGRDRIIATWRFAPADVSEDAEWAWRLWRDGYINATSIGILPLKVVHAEEVDGIYKDINFTGIAYTQSELVEFSVVTLPALREALRVEEDGGQISRIVTAAEEPDAIWGELILKSLGNTKPKTSRRSRKKGNGSGERIVVRGAKLGGDQKVEIVERGAISYERAHPNGTPKAPEDTPWDGPEQVAAADVDDLKVMCAWVDSEFPDLKGSYKLPHHEAEGRHRVVWRGVWAAMAALFGARGGVNIPDADRRGVYDHLARHYREFDKEPPGFKEYSAEELIELFPDLYPERTIDEVRLACAAGAISAAEALALAEKRIVAPSLAAKAEAEAEAKKWQQECASLAARIILLQSQKGR